VVNFAPLLRPPGYLLLAGLWHWWDVRESGWTLRRQVARHWTVEFVALLTGIGTLLAMAWLLSAGVNLELTTELIGLPVFLIAPFFFYALLMPGLRWLLLLLQRFGLARHVDRERSVFPALVPAGAAGLIVLLVDYSEIPFGVSLGLVLAMLLLPLLAAALPPLLMASATMRRLERRLRAWAHAEPAPLAEAPVSAPVEGPAEAVLEPGGSA